MGAVIYMIRRELLLAMRQRAELVNAVLFYCFIVVLFPLAIGAQAALITKVAPAIIWVAALLSVLLSIDRTFRSDFEDGSLEQLILSAHPLSLLVLGKILAHWLVSGLPLLVLTPLLTLFLGMDMGSIKVLLLTLLLGTPVLSAVGAIGVALTVGLRRGGILLALLVLPMYVPVLIFATVMVEHARSGLPMTAEMSMLIAFLILALTLAPWPTAAALKVSVS
ncbi:MAG: heme exporter protein CcmB [Gammaproteobacteria bacterium]|nr:heme exporter protein CcmB [Gammaproteobacteria bacterium]